MSVQPREHASSSTIQFPAKLQCTMSHNHGTRRRPATAPNSTSPSLMLPPSLHLRLVPQRAESNTIHDAPSPTAATLSRVFSRLINLGTNAKKSREIIPAVPDHSDDTVVRTGRKRLLRHPSRRLSTPSQASSSQHTTPSTARLVIPRPLPAMADIAPKNLTINSPFLPGISVGDETEEGNDVPGDHRNDVQLQMARLAKLKRHLGDEIPPEMVLSPALLVDTAKSRSLLGTLSNPKKGHQKRRSVDPTAGFQSAPPSSRLSKSRSLHDRQSIFNQQTRGDHAVEAAHTKLPYELHLARTEVDSSKPRKPRIRAPLRGSDDNGYSSSHGVQHPLQFPHLTTSTPSTSERLQTRQNLLTTDLAFDDDPSSSGRREANLEGFVGSEYPDITTVVDIDLRSPTGQSLHPAGDLDIRPSLSAQTPSYSELEVDVQISKRTRFWQIKVKRDVEQTVHPDDVTNQLRAMKVST
ncbi:hypothetical protein AZE42_00323 [Rhizopogon vesiculosus]|uniref:Uncharacterized protein n=1 Tax=Rhizopogon vesiculosus TaxID=180088 RepID=A0A1J8PPH0_9AGAM|nr:hypothetical protein AZE42_00323 [Rhizopogon vesiculosus]